MARTLICHVPKDGNLARDLGAALMGRGQSVSFDGEPDGIRPDRSARLRQFEAVIVIWTEASATSAGLIEIAREALPLNVLVPLRADDLPITRLPLMFRKLNMLSPRDSDGIARLVARLCAAASSLREIGEREAVQRGMAALVRGGKPAPERAPPPPPGRARGVLPPDRHLFKPPAANEPPAKASPSPEIPEAKATPEKEPPVKAAGPTKWIPPRAASVKAGPVAEAARVRVRPLSGLPEVEADPALVVRQSARVDISDSDDAKTEQEQEQPPSRQRQHADPPKPATQVLSAEDLAHAVESGLLVHHIPAAMWLGAPITVGVALGRDILADLLRPDGPYGVLGQSIESLSVSLYGSSEGFEIERQSERTQCVNGKHAGREHATSGLWTWLVRPRSVGVHELVIRVSALLRDRHGVPVPVVVPDRLLTTEVQIPKDENLVAALAGWYRR